MKKINQIVLILNAGMIIGTSLQAQVNLKKVGQSTMNFQLVGISPRASSMGEAFCAIGKGAESIFFNPAGVAETKTPFDLKMTITQWIADINYTAGALVYNGGSFGSIGFSVLVVDYGDMYATGLLSPSESSAYPQGYKDFGLMSNIGAYSAGLTYGRAVSTQFYIGGNVRIAGQNLGTSMIGTEKRDNNAHKLVFDAGIKYYTGLKSFRFGMAIRNFSSNLKREEIDEQLPVLFTMGFALDLLDFIVPEDHKNQTLTFAADFLHPNNYSERVNAGLEYMLFNTFAFRCGYQTNRDLADWSAGLGAQKSIGKKQMTFDYSYSNFDVFDGVNRLAIGIAF